MTKEKIIIIIYTYTSKSRVSMQIYNHMVNFNSNTVVEGNGAKFRNDVTSSSSGLV